MEAHVQPAGQLPLCAWWVDMLTLPELRELLAERFGVRRTQRSLQNVLSDVGIQPSHYHFNRRTGHGRVGYYDPLVCWAVLTSVKSLEPRTRLRLRFKQAVRHASSAVWKDFRGGVKSAPESVVSEWQWRCQATAIHLFISDPRHGLHPYVIATCRRDGLSAFTLDSPDCLNATLDIYSELLHGLGRCEDGQLGAKLSSGLDADRTTRVLRSLDEFHVLRASDERLGPGPVARQ